MSIEIYKMSKTNQPPSTVVSPEPRLKVLLSAYACEPNRGSEPGLGWNVVQQISQYHDIWVITRADRQPRIEAYIEANSLPNVHFYYYDLPYWMRFWVDEGRGLALHYYVWQLAVYRLAKKLHEEVNFDVAHHVTYIKYWAPSTVALLDIPFIWGPVGGAESVPNGFYQTLAPKERLYEYARNVARFIGHRDPLVARTARNAALALATTPESAEAISSLAGLQVEVMSEIALPDVDRKQLGKIAYHTEAPFRFFSIGRLLGWKGFHLGLKAFKQYLDSTDDTTSEYWLIGQGPRLAALKRLVTKLGIANRVTFWGAVDRSRVFELMAQCNVLVHPSLHEAGGWVCLEAMAARRPVICLDIGGPATNVTDATGIKIKPTTPQETIKEMSQAMRTLLDDPNLCEKMGQAGNERINNFYSWEAKGQIYANLYRQLAQDPTNESQNIRVRLDRMR